MCGRFTLRTPTHELADFFGFIATFSVVPRYNIAPTQDVLVVRRAGATRTASFMHWGLIPSWSKDPRMSGRMINARSDTLPTKPTFRTPFRGRRCLIVADGFFEWQSLGGKAR